jgi:hypothetical protein
MSQRFESSTTELRPAVRERAGRDGCGRCRALVAAVAMRAAGEPAAARPFAGITKE